MTMPSILRRGIVGSAALVTTGALSLIAPGVAGAGNGTPAPNGPTLQVQMLALNDFHGNLEPPAGSAGRITTGFNSDGSPINVDAGGAAYLATHLEQAREGWGKNSITVAPGDLIGASPLLSAAFHDEPTIEAMNLLGLDVASVGNHEFDEGKAELLRMQNGGCRTNPDGSTAADSCPLGEFEGADFHYLSANVINEDTSEPLLPPYWIENVRGAQIGFIGMTLEGTPDIVTAAGVAGLKFLDEVQTANEYAEVLARKGVNAIVVLVHEGGRPASSEYDYDCNAGGELGLSGPIVEIAENLDPRIDVVLSGHTHQSYVCDIPDPEGHSRMVTSASSFGRLFTEIDLSIDRRTKDVVRSSVEAQNFVVTRDVPADAAMSKLIEDYQVALGPIAGAVVGHIEGEILGRGCQAGVTRPASGEQPAGDLIADAQLWAMQNDSLNPVGADFAVMNPGGIRSDFACDAGPCEVTYGEAFAVQPFNNFMKVVEMTGSQVIEMFQQQWTTQEAGTARILQIPANVTYTYDASAAPADKLQVDTLVINGAPVDPAATYQVAMNEFLAGGGDNFHVIAEGSIAYTGMLDIDALVTYLESHSSPATPYPVPAADRITRLN